MDLNQKIVIGEFTVSSSIFFDFQNLLIKNNIDFEIKNRTDYDEGVSFDIAIFYINVKD